MQLGLFAFFFFGEYAGTAPATQAQISTLTSAITPAINAAAPEGSWK